MLDHPDAPARPSTIDTHTNHTDLPPKTTSSAAILCPELLKGRVYSWGGVGCRVWP